MLDAWHTALTWFLFVAVWLLRASLLCNAQAFQWKHFYRHRQWQRGRDTAQLFDCFVLFFYCFVLSLQTFCFYPSCSERFDFYHWHQASGFALHLLRSLIFRRRCWRMVLGMSCVYCGVPFQSHPPTHPHPSLLSAGARRLCLFYCGLGRVPVWAACHIPGYSMYSESCASFFFYFLCCVFFSNYCLTTAVVVAVCFVFLFWGFRDLPPWSLGGSALRWEADNVKVHVCVCVCVCVCFLRFKVSMVWELLG